MYRVAGCDCGGLDQHSTKCAIWELGAPLVQARVAEAKHRLDEYIAALNHQTVTRARTRHQEETRIVAALLTGGCYLFGKRVELSWPDGLPDGISEQTLRDMGKSMLDAP